MPTTPQGLPTLDYVAPDQLLPGDTCTYKGEQHTVLRGTKKETFVLSVDEQTIRVVQLHDDPERPTNFILNTATAPDGTNRFANEAWWQGDAQALTATTPMTRSGTIQLGIDVDSVTEAPWGLGTRIGIKFGDSPALYAACFDGKYAPFRQNWCLTAVMLCTDVIDELTPFARELLSHFQRQSVVDEKHPWSEPMYDTTQLWADILERTHQCTIDRDLWGELLTTPATATDLINVIHAVTA